MKIINERVAPDDYNPTITGKAYKVFKVKNGKLYPPMVANPGGADTPIGVWLEAEEGEFAGLSKTGRNKVKSIGGGTLAYRPGWHLGDIPLAKQFYRTNKETGEKEFPADFVWAECDYVMEKDYQDEANSYGTTKSGKYQHSLAGLPKLPKDGYYRYRTNPNPDTVPWVITGAIKVNRLLDDFEVSDILESQGIGAPQRQGGNKTLSELGLNESLNEASFQGYTLPDSIGEYRLAILRKGQLKRYGMDNEEFELLYGPDAVVAFSYYNKEKGEPLDIDGVQYKDDTFGVVGSKRNTKANLTYTEMIDILKESGFNKSLNEGYDMTYDELIDSLNGNVSEEQMDKELLDHARIAAALGLGRKVDNLFIVPIEDDTLEYAPSYVSDGGAVEIIKQLKMVRENVEATLCTVKGIKVVEETIRNNIYLWFTSEAEADDYEKAVVSIADESSVDESVENNPLDMISDIIKDKSNLTTDSEGVTYLSQKAFNDIKNIVRENNITQDELDTVDQYMLNADHGGYGILTEDALDDAVPYQNMKSAIITKLLNALDSAGYDITSDKTKGVINEVSKFIISKRIKDTAIDNWIDIFIDNDHDMLKGLPMKEDFDNTGWKEIISKQIPDSDGFLTDYTMYKNEDDKYIFIFGDKDLYDPYSTEPDWEADSEEGAYEWFDGYTGFDDDDEDAAYEYGVNEGLELTEGTHKNDKTFVALFKRNGLIKEEVIRTRDEDEALLKQLVEIIESRTGLTAVDAYVKELPHFKNNKHVSVLQIDLNDYLKMNDERELERVLTAFLEDLGDVDVKVIVDRVLGPENTDITTVVCSVIWYDLDAYETPIKESVLDGYAVTYYNEYPIYEAAEGGYYYAGVEIVDQATGLSLEEAKRELVRMAEEYGIEINPDGDNTYAVNHSKYIGQEEFVVVESNKDRKFEKIGSRVSGRQIYESLNESILDKPSKQEIYQLIGSIDDIIDNTETISMDQNSRHILERAAAILDYFSRSMNEALDPDKEQEKDDKCPDCGTTLVTDGDGKHCPKCIKVSEPIKENIDLKAEDSWADQKYAELIEKGKENWSQEDWDAYNYIENVRFNSGYYEEDFTDSDMYPQSHQYNNDFENDDELPFDDYEEGDIK